MATDFKGQDFISNLLTISVHDLNKTPASPAVWFALDKDKNVLYIGETVKNLRDSLGGSQNKVQKLQEEHNYSITYIAYLLVDAQEVKNLAKKYKRYFKLSLKQNKSKIFVPAIKSLIKKITTTDTKTAINAQANFAVNFLRNIEKAEQGANASNLERILLSEFVTKDIFEEFIEEIRQRWKSSKGCTNDKQQPQVNDNAELEEAVLDDSEKKTMR